MTRVIADSCESYELRGAVIRRARQDYPCDVAGCTRDVDGLAYPCTIMRGEHYAYLSHGLRICMAHVNPADVIEVSA